MADDISDIAFFLAVAEAGGIGACARAIGSSPPAVSRRLSALERRLGVVLAERTARRFRLTDEGRLYRDRGRELGSAVRDLESELSERGSVLRGMLRVAAPTDLGRHLIAPALAAFADRHPGLSIHLVLSDIGAEVAVDGLDIAVRTGLPADSAVVTRKLKSGPMALCASPGYLTSHGIPKTVADLRGHRCLLLARRHHHPNRWLYHGDEGLSVEALLGTTLSSSSGDVLRQWAIGGAGLSLEATWDVSDDLAAGRLVQCLSNVAWREATLYATFLPGNPLSPKVRTAIDWIADVIGG